ncbi:MAG TPA: chemotaxis protein CheB [Pirellulales bacterium]|nr:chemotaxis protein CheB [Pirellulales bacterium]
MPAGTPASTVPAAEGQRDGDFPIVGIGASAGGLRALIALLDAMPADPGLALVIVQHLDPTRKSLTPELLAKHTGMRLREVADSPHVQINSVYVIPPGKYLSISEGSLHLSEPDQPRGARLAVDFFLRSLAQDRQQRGVGVILSGGGSDGASGIKLIKEAGGLVVVQDPETCEHDSMPRRAIETGVVDFIQSPEKIPEILVNYAMHPYVRQPAVPDLEEQAEAAPTDLPSTETFGGILSLLKLRSKHDFRNYKNQTLVRRLKRRMCLRHMDDYGLYLDYMREHPEEIDALNKDLLISVTNFFRDAEAWQHLRERVIRPIVEQKGADDAIRAWVPGCATGEEPYSLAMLILEELAEAKKTCPLQIFASDIDREALDLARSGLYPANIEADVSAERLKRFFQGKEDGMRYRVSKPLREAVVFADQNLIADPPFSKLDLICCRNLMIYLKPKIQEKVISVFHFALRNDGYLFLGSAETIGQRDDLFRTLDKRWRLYQRLGTSPVDRLEILMSPSMPRGNGGAEERSSPRQRETHLAGLANHWLMDMLNPTAVLIDDQWQMIYITGDVDRYLQHGPGVPTSDLLQNVRRGLRTKLRSAVFHARSEQRPVTVDAQVQNGGQYAAVRISVRPVPDTEEDRRLMLLVFDTLSPARERQAAGNGAEKGGTDGDSAEKTRFVENGLEDHAVIRQLEDQLAATKDDLQSTIEQLESSNEEFKAANEEVMSINEELQSTNEELETSKEELQSLNEELSTVNSQLGLKVEELEARHADLQNLVAATDVTTVCLDREVRIRWFTPGATRIIRLKESDAGRPLSDFAHDFVRDDVAEVTERVLLTLVPVEDEVACVDGRTFLRRVLPYQAEDHRIGGVVITFVDITQRKHSEEELRDLKDQLASDLEDMRRLHRIGMRMSREANPDALLNDILASATELLQADGATLQLLDGPGGGSQVRAQRGFEQPFLHGIGSWTTLVNFWHEKAETGNRLVVPDVERSEMLAGTPALELLRQAGVKALQSTPLGTPLGHVIGEVATYWRTPHRPSDRKLHMLDLLVRQASDWIERSRAEIALRESERRLRVLSESLEQQVRSRVTAMSVLHDITMAANEAITVTVALHAALKRICNYNRWAVGHAWLTSPDRTQLKSTGIWQFADAMEPAIRARLAEFQAMSERTEIPLEGTLLGQVVREGKPRWIDDVDQVSWVRESPSRFGLRSAMAIPVLLKGEAVAALELFSTELLPREERFMEITANIGVQLGHVFQRKALEQDVAMISEDERRYLEQEVHDGLCQQIAGIAMLATSLVNELNATPQSEPLRQTAERLRDAAEDAKTQSRQLSKGLAPIEFHPGGLELALREIAIQTQLNYGIQCSFAASDPPVALDEFRAGHLYRIAREAIHNAVKHAQCQRIQVSLDGGPNVTLTIEDDGIGIDRSGEGLQEGTGLRIIRLRAELIGASFSIAGAPEGGTVLICQLGGGVPRNDQK